MGANAQTSVPAFTAGQVLTAAQMTQVNTGIPVFASSTERDAAFGGAGEKTLAEGQMAYLEDTNATQYYDGSSWAAVAGGKILQVVSTTKTDTYSVSLSATSEDASNVTGFEATLTPSSASNKIFVMLSYSGTRSGGVSATAGVLYRDSTAIGVGDAAGSRSQISMLQQGDISDNTASLTFQYLDSPSTTSAVTYGWRLFNQSSSTRTMYVNRDDGDTNAATTVRTAATITVMEVSA